MPPLALRPLLVLTLLLAACGSADEPAPVAAGEPAYFNLGPEATYVGQETCGSCHGDRYATYVASEMGRSFRKATFANSDAPWDGIEPIYDADRDLHYLPFRRGEDLFVREFRLAGRDTVHQRVEPITYIVGSGHHTNSHIRDVNGYLYQVPVTWYAQAGRWDLAPGFGSSLGRFSRPITEACMTCHNGLPGFVEGSENKFDHVPLGIDCERCHGPGSLHVEARRMGRTDMIEDGVDRSIVNPATLPPALQMNVCERCHAQGAAVYHAGRGPADFRPGMALSDVEHVFWLRDADSTTHFTMASHPDRLRMSACFDGSRDPERATEPMTCLTCHNPHLSINVLGADHYADACRSCHAADGPDAPPACTEPTVVRDPAAADCASCHMPESGASDIPNVRITDHYIRRPDAPRRGDALSEAEAGRRAAFLRLVSVLEDAPTEQARAEGYLTYYEEITNRPGVLDSAAVHLARARRTAPLAELAPTYARLHFLRRDYAALRALVREVGFDALPDAWTHYRAGEAFTASGETELALRHLQRAVDLAPDFLRFRARLAGALTDAGRPAEAVRHYDHVLAENPTFEVAYNDRGWARVLLGDYDGAEADFERAVALDPDAEQALANLASLYYNTGRPDAARPLLRRLLRLDPSNPDYRRLGGLIGVAGTS